MTDEKKPGVPLGARLKNLFIGGLIGLTIGGGWAGYVWWTGGQALSDAQSAHQADLDAAQKAAQDLNVELEAERRRSAVLGARAEVSRAMESVDRQNYGLVRDQLARASQRLEGVEGATAIRDRLGAVTVDPTMPEVGRGTILGLAGELDALAK